MTFFPSREYVRHLYHMKAPVYRALEVTAWVPFRSTTLYTEMNAPYNITSAEADAELERLFTYQSLEATAARLGTTPDEVSLRYKAINDAAFQFAKLVQETVPPGADATTAIRTIRLARMWANAGIACAAK